MSPQHRLALVVCVAAAMALLSGCPEDQAPLPLGSKIVLVLLNEAHSGDLGGLAGADALCASEAQAAGREETFVAFLSAGRRDVRYLIDPQMVDQAPVQNAQGEKLFASWRNLFELGPWEGGANLYTFEGNKSLGSSGASPRWVDGYGWHGSDPNGLEHMGLTCRDWTSDSSDDQGASGDLVKRRLLKQGAYPCSATLAVICVGVGKPPAYGPCPQPGQPCTAADPCAVDPVCGEDKQCRPSKVISCDDGKACTDDRCDGKGGCRYTLQSGWCLIDGTCYQDGAGDANGCNRCEPKKSTTAWTPLTDGCNIAGRCYQVGEADDTGCKVCDPTRSGLTWSPLSAAHCAVGSNCYREGEKHPQACAVCAADRVGMIWKVESGFCLIDHKCVLAGVKDKTGCKECDPAAAPRSWTPITSACLIDGKCYKQGEKHPQGCAHCDVAKDASGWTPLGSACVIDGDCYAAGAKSSSGCGVCDPAQSLTSWTVQSNTCLINKVCHQPGALDPVGCSRCDPSVSKLRWTPVPGCFKIVLTALNNAHNGALGGTAGADALCAAQAQAVGYGGTFRAFLSSSTQNAMNLITGSAAQEVVVNTHGQQPYPSWSAIISTSRWPSGRYLYAFDGKKVDENTGAVPSWYDARGWTGTMPTGDIYKGNTCHDWTSAASSDKGASGELDMRRLLYSYTDGCNKTLAVVCVRTK